MFSAVLSEEKLIGSEQQQVVEGLMTQRKLLTVPLIQTINYMNHVVCYFTIPDVETVENLDIATVLCFLQCKPAFKLNVMG